MPLEHLAALARDHLSERRQELAEHDEVGALDVTARMLHALHVDLAGAVPCYTADRTPRYRRAQLAGERTLPLEDLVYVLLTAGRDVALDALGPLLDALGYRASERHGLLDEQSAETAAVNLITAWSESLGTWAAELRRGACAGNAVTIRERMRDLDRLAVAVDRYHAALRRAYVEQSGLEEAV